MCDQTMANNKMDVFDVFPRMDVIQGVVLIMPCWFVQKLSHCVNGNHRSYIYNIVMYVHILYTYNITCQAL